MEHYPLALCDQQRLHQFPLVRTGQRIFQDAGFLTDADDIPWRVRIVRGHALAFTSLGQGWVFNSYARERRAERWQRQLEIVKSATDEEREAQLNAIQQSLRLGKMAERMLWTIHRLVLELRTSVLFVPAHWIGKMVWGLPRNELPRQYHRQAAHNLQSLSWLHVAEWDGSGELPFGPMTALSNRPQETLLVALDYLRRGWLVVPQLPGAKKPCVLWKPYQTQRATEDVVREWFEQWPKAGIAVVLGPISDLFVIDEDGPEAHLALMERLGREPVTPKSISGSRKPHRYHLFFQHPDLPTKAKFTPWHPKLEFRGTGGLIILPPSLHKSGNRYSWAEGRSPAELPLPVLPDEIQEELGSHRQNSYSAELATVTDADPKDFEVSTSTQQFLLGAYSNGPSWNDRLFRAACDLAGRGVSKEVAKPKLLAGARPWNETERNNAMRTIESAYSQSRVPGTH